MSKNESSSNKLIIIGLAVVVSCFTITKVHAQDIKSGAYSSLHAFVIQEPMDGITVTISAMPDSYEWRIEPYRLNLTFPKSIGKRERKNLKYTLWGFYDGSNLYINSTYITTFYEIEYFKVIYLGQNLILVRGTENLGQKSNKFIGGILSLIPEDEYFVLSHADGLLGKLNEVFMNDILSPFPELHTSYTNEAKHNKDLMIAYIAKLDELVSERF